MSICHLRTYNGYYLCAEGGGGREVNATRTAAGSWETFDLESTVAGTSTLKANNGQYVCAEGGGGSAVNANRTVAQVWESFVLEFVSGGGVATGSQVHIRTSDGHYMCAEQGGGGQVNATRTAAAQWETFTLEVVGGTAAAAIDSYIATLGHLPPVNPVAVSGVGPPSTTTLSVGWDAVTQRMQGTAVYDKVVTFGTDQSVIWPGSVLQGGHVLDTAPAPVPLRRSGLTITVTGLSTKAGVSASRSVAIANTAMVTDAMNALLGQSFADVTTADLDVFVSQAYSVENSCQQLGISAHFLSSDVKAQMSHSFQDKKASFVANVTQKYFNVSASDPGPGSSYFDPGVTPAEASPYMGQGNPPLYVSSISFGRRLVLLMLTDKREESFDADIQATYGWVNGSASGKGGIGMNSLVSESAIHLFDIGGSTAAGVKVLSANPGEIAAIQTISDYIAAGANWSASSPGAPIGWTLRYVDDAVGFLAADALDYNTLSFRRKCFPNTVVVNQDNSGFNWDRQESHVIPAPNGTKIDVNSVQVSPQVYRGAAHITGVNTSPDAITVGIWTQAAGGFPFGHHSGGVDVTVNFASCGA
ncbi:MAG: thiol-activated cytolysin family protein [Actinomycetota bacterium]|nr:thiol-activated cytolysin family protein [Actinomycetota bacterium]